MSINLLSPIEQLAPDPMTVVDRRTEAHIRIVSINTQMSLLGWAAYQAVFAVADMSKTDIATNGLIGLFVEIYGKAGLRTITEIADRHVPDGLSYKELRQLRPRPWTGAIKDLEIAHRNGELEEIKNLDDVLDLSGKPFRCAEFNCTISVPTRLAAAALDFASPYAKFTDILEYVFIAQFRQVFGKAALARLIEMTDEWKEGRKPSDLRRKKSPEVWQAWREELADAVESEFEVRVAMRDLVAAE